MTWSIVAVDPATGEVGAAAATCTVGVEMIHRIVPGRGVIVAQAATNLRARNHGARLISAGRSADDVVAAVANRRFNPGRLGARPWTEQQYGVAVIGPEPTAANFTGAETVPWSGARSTDELSVQGNMLRDAAVVEATFAAMCEASAQHGGLADRLVRGLEAGAAAGGDHRCAADRAALTAFVAVARTGDPVPGKTRRRLLLGHDIH